MYRYLYIHVPNSTWSKPHTLKILVQNSRIVHQIKIQDTKRILELKIGLFYTFLTYFQYRIMKVWQGQCFSQNNRFFLDLLKHWIYFKCICLKRMWQSNKKCLIKQHLIWAWQFLRKKHSNRIGTHYIFSNWSPKT